MLSRVAEHFDNPMYALYLIRRRLFAGIRGRRFFASSEEYRSDSENGEYAAAVMDVLRSQKTFEVFKRKAVYQAILEHVSKSQGAAYLNILKSREDGLLEAALGGVLLSDSVGHPKKYQYDGIDIKLSPTTLRYVKVASDLKRLFGERIEHVAEIGCGYGGQCLVNDQLLGYGYTTLFDLPFVNELIRRYLGYVLMNGAYEIATINEKIPQDYDLVISNYAFSELPRLLQLGYVDKVLSRSKRGYLTMNSGIGGERTDGKLVIDELRSLLPRFDLLEEEPLTSAHNYVIVWGHDSTALDGFQRKAF